jgi:hypothetical protein
MKDALKGLYRVFSLMFFFCSIACWHGNYHPSACRIVLMASIPGIIFWIRDIYKIIRYDKQ